MFRNTLEIRVSSSTQPGRSALTVTTGGVPGEQLFALGDLLHDSIACGIDESECVLSYEESRSFSVHLPDDEIAKALAGVFNNSAAATLLNALSSQDALQIRLPRRSKDALERFLDAEGIPRVEAFVRIGRVVDAQRGSA